MATQPGVLLVQKFLKRKFANVRETLDNENFHFMPLNLAAFKIVLQGSVDDLGKVDKIFNGLLAHLKQRHTRLVPMSGISRLTKKELDNSPALIYEGTPSNIVGALYPTYASAYRAGFAEYLNKSVTEIFMGLPSEIGPSSLLDGSKYEKSNLKKGFDVGHMFAGSDSSFGDTPLSRKFRILKQAVDNLSNNKLVLASRSGVNPGSANQSKLQQISARVSKALLDLEKQSNLGIQVTGTLSKSLTAQLAKVGAVIVVPQGRIENQQEYGRLVEAVLERDIAKLLTEVKFSPNIKEDIKDSVIHSIIGKKKKTVSSNISIPVTVVKNPVKTKIKKILVPGVPIRPRISTREAERSLASLPNLLNGRLAAVIKNNMGTGDSRSILNLRTGRLAESAQVERVSESRTGMITAFYTYMKYPYATFSGGGRQERPLTRDPRLLIAKSIREIGAQMAYNRMRAVNV
jgi:hypothetical protein